MPTYDTALNWNREQPIGSTVTVTLADGRTVQDHTASGAVQWGSIALVTLKDRPGLWMTDMLTAIPVVLPVE